MPHGGYHGTLAVNPGTTLAVGQGSGLTIGPDKDDKIIGGQSVLTNQGIQNVGGSAPSTTENIEKQIEDKKKEIEALNLAQSGGDPLGQFPFATSQGAVGIDAINLAKQQQFQNQLLNNLLRQQQEINLANQIKDSFAKFGSDKQTADNLRKLFTGDLGDKTFLGINLGSTETTDPDKTSGLGAATVINPFTGERITTGKIREGMTSPEYAQYMSELYNLNPALMEQMFPVASGNLAQPILTRLLEGGLGGVGSGIGSFIDSATGAIFKPKGGTFTPSGGGLPTLNGISDPGAGGSSKPDNIIERSMPLFTQIPEQFREGFLKFYNEYEGPKAGGMAITPVTLPDGSVIEFGDTGTAAIFREYLESLGISQPPATGVDKIASQPTGISKFDVDKFYASLPQYTQQGIMSPNLSRFTDALKMFPGATV